MYQNLFKISLRLLWRDRFFTLLNVLGLAAGLTAAVFMFLWVQDELTFDHFHTRGDRIFRVLTNWKFGEAREWTSTTPAPLKDEAFPVTPGIEQMVRTFNLGEEVFVTGANRSELEKVVIVENGFFDIFDFQFALGDPATALDEPGNVVLTESAAIKIFGKVPPLGTPVRHSEKGDYVVGGILKDLPTNSTLKFDAIIPWESNIFKFLNNPKNAFRWGQINFGCWVLLRPDANAASVAGGLSQVAGNFRKDDEAFYFSLQNIRDVHLHSDFLRWKNGTGSFGIIRLVGLIGLIVLLIACINYVNLTTARAHGRAKSVGVRQTMGAGKSHLFAQAMVESGVTVLSAMVLAALLIKSAMPAFEALSGKEFTAEQVLSPGALAVFMLTGLAAWLLSGVQPAVQVTRFKPVKALKGSVPRSGNAWMRKSLVVGQFTFSVGLGICSLLVFRQLQFAREKDLGFDKSHTFMLRLPKSDGAFKNELKNQPGIIQVCMSDNPFVDLGSQCSGDDWEGKKPDQASELWQINVDSDFPQTFDLHLKEGRWFKAGDADSLSFVLNETAVKAMQIQDPVGKWISHGGVRGNIVGVAKDFHFQSVHAAIEPLIISQFPKWYYIAYVKTTGAAAEQAIASTRSIFQRFYPEKIFDYEFLDDQYDDLYKSEARLGGLTGVFTGLALLISCLGLFGLAAFAAAQRTKEIGVRKVLGASAAGIMALLSRDFLKLVVMAIVIASPVAYYFMDKWLADFAYRIAIQWWIFALAAAAALLIALLTIGFQSLRAALTNPVDALRNE